MRLYFSRPEQVAVAALVLVILAALVTLTVVHGRRAAAEGPFLQHTAFTTLPRPDAELVVHVAGAGRTRASITCPCARGWATPCRPPAARPPTPTPTP